VPFALPQGCTAYVTIQMASCTVSHAFTCAADPAGVQRRVDLDEEGVTYFGAIDAEAQWLESTHVRAGHSEALAPDPADPMSFSELVETGVDNFDFTTLSDEIGPTRFVGGDSLTGQTVVIDGVTLEQTRYSIRATDAAGTEMWSSEGFEFISRDWRDVPVRRSARSPFRAAPSTATTGRSSSSFRTRRGSCPPIPSTAAAW
jgi:hypothetical protein